MTARTRFSALAMALVAVLLGLTACSGDPKPEVRPEDTLAAAKQNLDRTSGVRIGLSTPKLPTGVSGLVGADGVATHDPAFKGTIKVAASGVTADAAVVAVGGVVYAKLPFTSKFVKIDPADYSAPDPADLMNPDHGLSSVDLDGSVGEADCVAIVTAHSGIDYAELAEKAQLVVDFRNATGKNGSANGRVWKL